MHEVVQVSKPVWNSRYEDSVLSLHLQDWYERNEWNEGWNEWNSEWNREGECRQVLNQISESFQQAYRSYKPCLHLSTLGPATDSCFSFQASLSLLPRCRRCSKVVAGEPASVLTDGLSISESLTSFNRSAIQKAMKITGSWTTSQIMQAFSLDTIFRNAKHEMKICIKR